MSKTTTTKQRINITVRPDDEVVLRLIAKRDRVPVATKAAELIRFALEIDEDLALGALVEERDTPDAKYISHDEVWKRIRANRK